MNGATGLLRSPISGPMLMVAVLSLWAPLEVRSEVTVVDLIDGYDDNMSLIQDLSVTFSYVYTPSTEWEEVREEMLAHNKRVLRYSIEQGHVDPFVDSEGDAVAFDAVSDQMWRDRIYPAMHNEIPTRSHRYMEKGPVLRSWENGTLAENGSFVPEYRIAFDGLRHMAVMPLLRTGRVAQTFNFHAVEEPRTFLPGVNHHRWPDFARVPPPGAELKVAGVEEVDGQQVYRVTYTMFDNPLTSGRVKFSYEPDEETLRRMQREMRRLVYTVTIDADRGFSPVASVLERSTRRTPEEAFAVFDRTIVDKVTLESDRAGLAWFITGARIRNYTRDPRWSSGNADAQDEVWPPNLVLKGTWELITHEIKINEGLAEENFRIEFPDGYAVYNDITGAAYVVGGVSPDAAILDAAQLLREAEKATALPPDNCFIKP